MEALDRAAQLTVYRIAQEALTNTLKHAGTRTRAELQVAVQARTVLIRVQDSGPPDGPGAAPPNEEGHGLAGMRERAALYGGTILSGPAAGGGWTVEALLSLTPPADPGGSAP